MNERLKSSVHFCSGLRLASNPDILVNKNLSPRMGVGVACPVLDDTIALKAMHDSPLDWAGRPMSRQAHEACTSKTRQRGQASELPACDGFALYQAGERSVLLGIRANGASLPGRIYFRQKELASLR